MTRIPSAIFAASSPSRSRGRAHHAIARCSAALLYVTILLASLGCQVQLVASYDRTADIMAEALQSKIDHQFQTWIRLPAGSPALRYEDSSTLAFYAGASADLSVLGSRIQAQPLNEISSGIVTEIVKSLKTIEDFHKTNRTISPTALQIAQGELDFQFQRLVAFELDKKRNETKEK